MTPEHWAGTALVVVICALVLRWIILDAAKILVIILWHARHGDARALLVALLTLLGWVTEITPWFRTGCVWLACAASPAIVFAGMRRRIGGAWATLDARRHQRDAAAAAQDAALHRLRAQRLEQVQEHLTDLLLDMLTNRSSGATRGRPGTHPGSTTSPVRSI